MGRRWARHHPVKFCNYGYCGSGDIMLSAYHVITRDHLIKRSCYYKGLGTPPW